MVQSYKILGGGCGEPDDSQVWPLVTAPPSSQRYLAPQTPHVHGCHTHSFLIIKIEKRDEQLFSELRDRYSQRLFVTGRRVLATK